jgi:hypothetical protein
MALTEDDLKGILSATIAQNKKLASTAQDDEERRKQEEFAKQLQEEQKKLSEKGKEKKRGLLSKILDTANPADNGRSWTTDKPSEDNKKNSLEQVGDVGRALFSNSAKTLNTAAEGIRKGTELARATGAAVTDNEDAMNAALDRGTNEKNSLLQKGRGLLGAGGIMSQNDLRDYSTGDMVKDIAGAGAGTAGEILPGGKALKGAGTVSKAVRAGAEGAAIGTVGELGNQALDEKSGVNAKDVAIAAATGGVLGAGADVLGSAVKGSKAAKAADNEKKLVDAQAKSQADIASGVDPSVDKLAAELSAPTNPDTKLLPERTQPMARPLKDVEKELQELQTNGDPTLTPDQAKQKFQSLREELTIAQKNDAERKFQIKQATFEANVPKEDAVKQLDDLKSGKLSDDLMDPMGPAKTIDEAPINIPELEKPVAELNGDKVALRHQLAQLMTPEDGDAAKASLDMKYNDELAKLEAMPEVRRAYEKQQIDAEYEAKLQEIDDQVLADAPKAQELLSVKNEIALREEEILRQANQYRDIQQDKFLVPNEERIAARKAELEKNIAAQSRTLSPAEADDVLTETVVNNTTPQKFSDQIENDPAIQKATVQLNEDSGRIFGNNDKSPGALSWYVGTPTSVLKSWGEWGKMAADSLEEANYKYSKHRGTFIIQLRDWNKALGGRESAKNVFDSLDGKKVDLNESEMAVRDEMKQYFSDMADQLGLDKDRRIQDYVPHMFESTFGKKFDSTDLAIQKLRSGVDEQGNKLSQAQIHAIEKDLSGIDAETMQYIARNSSWKVKNGFLERRTGAEGYSDNLINTLNAYDHMAAKKVWMEPTMKDLNAVSGQLNGEQQKYLMALFNNIRGTQKTKIETTVNSVTDQLFKTEDSTGKFLRGYRRITNASMMGGSLSTVLKNLQQMANVASEFNPKEMIQGSAFAVHALRPDSPAMREIFEQGVMDASFSAFLRSAQQQAKDGARGFGQKAITKGEAALWAGMSQTDMYMRATAYGAAKAKHLKANPGDVAGAQKAGRMAAKKTNFEFSDIDIPVSLNNEVGRSLLQMQTFNLQQAKFIKDKFVGDTNSMFVKQPDGGYKLSAKGVANMAKLVAGTTAFYATIGSALGMKEQDLIPFANEISEGRLPQSPLVSLVIGQNSNPGLVDLASEGIKAAKGQDNKLSDKAQAFGTKLAWSLTPAGSQIKRTTEGMDSVEKGYSENPSGKIRFIQGDDTDTQLKAALFGQYTTEAGRQWVDNGTPTLSDKQSEKIKTLPNKDKQKEYYDFYQAAKKVTGRDEAISQIKEAALAGDQKRAIRISNEYSQSLNEAMSKYWDNHDNMPLELQDQMMNEMRIDTLNVMEKAIKGPSTKQIEKENKYKADNLGM